MHRCNFTVPVVFLSQTTRDYFISQSHLPCSVMYTTCSIQIDYMLMSYVINKDHSYIRNLNVYMY